MKDETTKPLAMEYPKENSKSLYDYSDKSVQHAGYAAITYAVINLFGGVLSLIQHFIYHRPGTGGYLSQDYVSQQYLQHTPLLTAITIGFSIIVAAVSGVLAFFIFRNSRFAVVAMLGVVILLQLFTWFVAHSAAGSLLSIVVTGVLLRGARRIFQDHAEHQLEATRQV
jgi:hypothetical protein